VLEFWLTGADRPEPSLTKGRVNPRSRADGGDLPLILSVDKLSACTGPRSRDERRRQRKLILPFDKLSARIGLRSRDERRRQRKLILPFDKFSARTGLRSRNECSKNFLRSRDKCFKNFRSC
jgi:hypothetical protein